MPDYFIDGRGSVKTVLSEQISLSGELSFEDSLEIHGKFSGVIRSKGLLIIGPSAVIEGDIYSKDLLVEGKILGNILVYNRLSIEAKAEVVGDIFTHKIKITNNAALDGNCFTLDTADLLGRFHTAAPETYFRTHYSEMITPKDSFQSSPTPEVDETSSPLFKDSKKLKKHRKK